MTFGRRLRTYLVGVGLGLIIVYVFFGDRDLSGWTPEGRILTTIDSSTVTISSRAICQFICYNLSADEWKDIQADASVNFSESNTQKKPCPVYQLNNVYKGEEYLLFWEVCENAEKVELLGIAQKANSCNCPE